MNPLRCQSLAVITALFSASSLAKRADLRSSKTLLRCSPAASRAHAGGGTRVGEAPNSHPMSQEGVGGFE